MINNDELNNELIVSKKISKLDNKIKLNQLTNIEI